MTSCPRLSTVDFILVSTNSLSDQPLGNSNWKGIWIIVQTLRIFGKRSKNEICSFRIISPNILFEIFWAWKGQLLIKSSLDEFWICLNSFENLKVWGPPVSLLVGHRCLPIGWAGGGVRLVREHVGINSPRPTLSEAAPVVPRPRRFTVRGGSCSRRGEPLCPPAERRRRVLHASACVATTGPRRHANTAPPGAAAFRPLCTVELQAPVTGDGPVAPPLAERAGAEPPPRPSRPFFLPVGSAGVVEGAPPAPSSP
jgi:hypothetical protein